MPTSHPPYDLEPDAVRSSDPASSAGAAVTPAPVAPAVRSFAWLMLITAAGAWIASAVLVAERLHLYADPRYTTSCDLNSVLSCGTVMRSAQASIFGFPNPLIGIVGYGVVVTIAFALLAGARFAKWFWACVCTGLSLAVLMLGYLFYSALFSIGALCIYCMIVWFFTLPLWIFTLKFAFQQRILPVPAAVRDLFANWAWVITAVMEILVFGTVFLFFNEAFLG